MSTRADACSRILEMHQAEKVEGYLIDAMTARVLLAVYAALSPTARAKFDAVPLPRLVDFAWKHVNPALKGEKMASDDVITLPSGTETSVEAALGDLARTRQHLAEEREWMRGHEEQQEIDGLICDLGHVEELLRLLDELLA